MAKTRCCVVKRLAISVPLFQVKNVEETLKKIKNEFQSRSQKKPTDFTNKVQLKKMVDEMEKEIGLPINVL